MAKWSDTDLLGFARLLGMRVQQKFNPRHEPAGSPTGGQFASGEGRSEHRGEDNVLYIKDSDAENVISRLPRLESREGVWAARYTNDWNADKRRGYSFAEWGVSPYSSKDEAKNDFPNNEIVYDRKLKGYLPRLDGLSSFADLGGEASISLSKARRWHGGGAYKYLVVYRAHDVGTGPDGEDLTLPKENGEQYIIKL